MLGSKTVNQIHNFMTNNMQSTVYYYAYRNIEYNEVNSFIDFREQWALFNIKRIPYKVCYPNTGTELAVPLTT